MDSEFRPWFYAGPTRHFGHSPCQKKKGKNGTKTHGRRARWCGQYRLLGLREAHKRRRLSRHLKRHPNDLAAHRRLQELI